MHSLSLLCLLLTSVYARIPQELCLALHGSDQVQTRMQVGCTAEQALALAVEFVWWMSHSPQGETVAFTLR